jgi:hypothetical protein
VWGHQPRPPAGTGYERGHGVKSFICKELREAVRRVNSKGGPKGKTSARALRYWAQPWLWGLTVLRGMLLEQRRALCCVLKLLGQTFASQRHKGKKDK